MSPALWSARYHLGTVALLMAPAAYVLDRPRRRAVTEAVLAVATLLALAHLARLSPPLGGASISEIASYTKLTPSERAARSVAEWAMAPDVARARDRELGAGTSVAFGGGVAFPSTLYDERFAGHLEYVPETDAAAIDAHVARARPTWIVAAPDEPLHRYATERFDLWERIGFASRNAPTIAFRRRKPVDGAPPR
jgi:hypothetical protein